jgi:hypothetical protein
MAVVGAGRRRGGIGAEIFHNLSPAVFAARRAGQRRRRRRRGDAVGRARRRDRRRRSRSPSSPFPASRSRSGRRLHRQGREALLIISAGFGETGAEGREMEAAIVEKYAPRAFA